MPEVALEDALRVTVVLSEDSDEYVNRYHCLWNGDPASYSGYALAFRTLYDTIKAEIPDTVTLEEVRLATHGLSGWTQQYVDQTTVSGLGTTALPRQLAIRTTFVPEVPAGERPWYGGPYIGPWAGSAMNSSGKLLGTVRTLLGDALIALDDTIQVLTGSWGLGLYRTLPIIPDQVFSLDKIRIGNVFDTQRSRRSEIDESYLDFPIT